MSLLKLLSKEINRSLLVFLGLVLLTGLTSAIIVELINRAADSIVNKNIQERYFILFVIAAILFYFSRDYIFRQVIIEIEAMVTRLRQQIGNKIRHLSLSEFEKEANTDLYARLTQDVLYISSMSFHLIGLLQAVITILFMLFYIALLSGWTCFLLLSAIILSIFAYLSVLEELNYNFNQLSKVEPDFLKKLNYLIKGFKEIKINTLKSKTVFANYKKAGYQKKTYKIKINQLYNKAFTYAQVIFYSAIAISIFIIPDYQNGLSASIIKITAAILFIIGPFEIIFRVLPRLAYADNAARNILQTEKDLDNLLEQRRREPSLEKESNTLSFKNSIELKGVVYKYEENNNGYAFGIGPIDLTIKKGEILFITGNNGSGKSTFLKILTGLYVPQEGTIYVDRASEEEAQNISITSYNYEQYSNLFTTIFTDFHLFSKLYGIPKIKEETVNKLLKEMGLSQEKTFYRNGRFTNLNLSSGQKKRLALAISILEDKDIYILDEVAADLDPEFRDTYYYKFLGELKARNKTVFVVSHDKQYWEVGDRILHLENGQFYDKTIL